MPAQRVSKPRHSAEWWRSKFKRVYEADQCFPGAMYALLRSADEVLGSGFCAKNELSDVSRRLGYRKGSSTGAHAGLRNPFRHYLSTYGLTYREEIGPSDAFQHLKDLVASPTSSHPLVSVRLGFASAADPSTDIVGTPSDEDHVIVILEIEDNTVEFFDATSHPELHGSPDSSEKAPVDTLLRFWAANTPEPFLRGWVEMAPRKTARQKVKGKSPRRTLESFSVYGGAR